MKKHLVRTAIALALIAIGWNYAEPLLVPGKQVQFDEHGRIPAFPMPADPRLAPYIAFLQYPERAWGGRDMTDGGEPTLLFESDPDLPAATQRIRDELDAMLTTYAPGLWWHPADPYPPQDPMEFLARSSLWFRHDWSRDELIAEAGTVNAYELGLDNTGVYTRRARTLWWERDTPYTPASFAPMTRPYEPRGIEGGDEGFYLQYEDPTLSTGIDKYWWTESLGGDTYTTPFPQGTIPMFWKWGISPVVVDQLGTAPAGQARILIEYWYHLAFSHATPVWVGNHQGEWESVAMVLDIGVDTDGRLTHDLKTAFYAAHEYGTWYCPEELTWIDANGASHPEAFTALGTHATFNAPGEFGRVITDRTARGRRWDTWKLLRPMANEPYFGYSGGWGKATVFSFMSGPLVPGPTFKILPKRAVAGEEDLLAAVRARCHLSHDADN